ncbi:MAG: polygalacturonase [Frondihabitans sp.]|nr:polygalacturonase [Frondihabitans sp.]
MEADVADFGAVGDGVTKDTGSIQAAIDACHDAHGGTVVVRDGVFVVGTLRLRSNVTIRVDAPARILGSPDIADYATDTHHQRYRNESALDRCLIYAEDADSIGLTGTGVIDGNAVAFPNDGDPYRPMMIRTLRCANIRLSGLRLLEAAAWTTAFLDSEYIWVDGVHIHNETRYNGDGLDFDGSRHIWVSNCRISGTDDNLCLQSSSRERPVENVHITNCEFRSLCAGIRIGLKSIGNIRDVVISNCTMRDVWREGIKIESTEGGTIENVSVTNVVMRNVRRPIFLILNNRFEPDDLGSSLELTETPAIGRLRHVVFSSVTAIDDAIMREPQIRLGNDVMGSPRFNGIRIDAEADHPIEGVTLRDVSYTSVGGVRLADIPQEYPVVVDRLVDREGPTSSNYYPDWSRAAFLDARNVRGLVLDNLVFDSIEPDERPARLIDGISAVPFEV